MKGFALGLALKQRRKATRKSPIHFIFFNSRYIQRFHFVSALEFSVIFLPCGFPANRKQSVLMNIDLPLDSSREHLSSLFDFSASLFSPSSSPFFLSPCPYLILTGFPYCLSLITSLSRPAPI